jgi:transcription elongation factor Elf1
VGHLYVCKKCGLRGEFDKEPEDWFKFDVRKGTPEYSEHADTIILCPDCGKEAVEYFMGKKEERG